MRTPWHVLVVVAACNASAETPPKSSLGEQVLAVHARMHARYAASRTVEQAIAFGDLDRARSEARTIVELREPDVLPAWQPYFQNVQAAARTVDAAKDLVAAARGTAALGGECAKCHTATSAKIKLAKEPAPNPEQRLAGQMAGHQWAAARMWEGLFVPSDERWLSGARALAASSPAIAAETGELGIADDAARMRLLATRAVKARPGDRVQLYGELLATCARCHQTIRDSVPATTKK